MTAMLRLYYNEIRTKDASLHCEHKVIANCSLSVRGSFKQTTNISLRSDAETTNFIELTNCWMSIRTPQKFVNSFKFVVSPSKAIYTSLLIRHPDYPSSLIQLNDFVHLHIVVRGKSVIFLI